MQATGDPKFGNIKLRRQIIAIMSIAGLVNDREFSYAIASGKKYAKNGWKIFHIEYNLH